MDNEISVIPFRFKYLYALLDLLGSNNYHNISEINMKTLPKIGYMALRNGYPVAAGFLRRVEGGYGQLDTLTSNALFGSQIRHEGLEKVVNSLLEEAKVLKLHGIISFTTDPGVLKRAESLGFHVVETTTIALKL